MESKHFSITNPATLLLRIGLAFVFLYAAVTSLQHPFEWVGYLPTFLTKMITATTLLKFFAIYELVLAVWLASGKYVRLAGLATAATLAGIVAASPSQLIITFRDIGLACMALALVFPDKSAAAKK